MLCFKGDKLCFLQPPGELRFLVFYLAGALRIMLHGGHCQQRWPALRFECTSRSVPAFGLRGNMPRDPQCARAATRMPWLVFCCSYAVALCEV